MYATPVIYPVSIVPDSIRKIYWLNPMVGIIEGYRVLLFGSSDIIILPLAWSFLVAVVTSILAYRWFKRKERELADRI
jgi:lipopolysaccharide transport system permease protein